jgi:hypothetical protein
MKTRDDPDFVASFWSWFDSLSIEEKKRFWYYSQDAAEVFFYNKFWKISHKPVDTIAESV